MADTKEVLKLLRPDGKTKLLAIVANSRGGEEASAYDQIYYLGFPFSVSEVFQQKNTNSSIEDSLHTVEVLQETCRRMGKELVVYLSMAFGNPYGEEYNEGIVFHWAHQLSEMGIGIISLADTVGVALPQQVNFITKHLVDALPATTIGVHLHSTATNWKEKLQAAYNAGARRFDGALKGIGGCPMANDTLIGNMNTEWMIAHFENTNINCGVTTQSLDEPLSIAAEIFF